MCDYTWKWYLNHYDHSSNYVIIRGKDRQVKATRVH